MNILLSTPISELTRVGAITAKRLAKLGIATVKDLLEHYPMRYEDYSQIFAIRDLRGGEVGSIIGTISSIKNKQTAHKKMSLIEAYLTDGQADIKIIWFNQPFLLDTLHEGDKIIVAGLVERDWDGCVMKSPMFEKYQGTATLHTARLVPIYPATYGLTQKQIRFLIGQSLKAANQFREIIPDEIRQNAKLIDKIQAIKDIHLPANALAYQAAARYLKFEELFITQLLVEQSRLSLQSLSAPAIPFQKDATQNLVKSLPFALTDDQRKVAWQILQDLSLPRPMNRLVQGEVGSGKTVVAAMAALNAALSGYQTALMAPTEILALQHYQTISQVFPGRAVALLTSKHSRLSGFVIPAKAGIHQDKEELDPRLRGDDIKTNVVRNDIKQYIADGKIDIAIGTHAIIQNDVAFHKLGLIVIDEQHRFGVEQRKLLKNKTQANTVPHLLSMTATPIPRSLALTLYGDLDISTIKQMPKNRLPIITKIIEAKNRGQVYEFIKTAAAAGRQAFVICPLVEESDKLGVKAATTEYEYLQAEIFPNLKVGLIHGRLNSCDKETVMVNFKNKKLDILVATAVVEVGVDVPNASIMIIEGAERFGLAQLHQFRGRVGRGEHQSHCFLFTDKASPDTKRRLQAFVQAKDGFAIAELDLQLRGAGQLYGTTQSGYVSSFKIATALDSGLASLARTQARILLENDSALEKYPNLCYFLKKYKQNIHFE